MTVSLNGSLKRAAREFEAGMGEYDLSEWMGRVDSRLDSILTEVGRLRDEQDRLRRLQDTLRIDHETLSEEVWGPDDDRRRPHSPGVRQELANLRGEVGELSKARNEADAVVRASRWLLGVTIAALGVMLSALGLLLRVTGVIG